MSDFKNSKVPPVIKEYETINREILDWDLIDFIVETERNLPDVMEYDAEYREAYWKKYPPNDGFCHLRYWWGLKKSELHDYYEKIGWDGQIALKTKDTPATENYAFAFVKCLTVRPEIRSWLPIEMDLTARKFFEGSEEGVLAHARYGAKFGLNRSYWIGKNLRSSYLGYLKLRYAPYIVPSNKEDYNKINVAYGLFIYANSLSAAEDRSRLFEILKYIPDEGYIIGTYFPEKYNKYFRGKL